MIIRCFDESDLGRAVELLEQLSPSLIDNDILRTAVADLSGDHYINVCEVNGLVIGTSHLYVQPNLSHGGKPKGHVENVVVDRNHREHGIGRLLVNDLLRVARERGCYKVVLNCKPENYGFYKGLGFRVTGEVEMRFDL